MAVRMLTVPTLLVISTAAVTQDLYKTTGIPNTALVSERYIVG